jgi:hypothetical protein
MEVAVSRRGSPWRPGSREHANEAYKRTRAVWIRQARERSPWPASCPPRQRSVPACARGRARRQAHRPYRHWRLRPVTGHPPTGFGRERILRNCRLHRLVWFVGLGRCRQGGRDVFRRERLQWRLLGIGLGDGLGSGGTDLHVDRDRLRCRIGRCTQGVIKIGRMRARADVWARPRRRRKPKGWACQS